jgi:hypothetical protein
MYFTFDVPINTKPIKIKIMPKIKKLENLHIVFWLFKDAGWAANIKLIAIGMILPTIIIAIVITYKQWQNLADRFHNMAISLWIRANSLWMVGEFFHWDEKPPYLRKMALIPFSIGILCVAYFYIFKYKSSEDAGHEIAE